MRATSPVYRFGAFELDAGRRRVSRGGEPVWLRDRQMDLLLLLVANAGHVVTKEAIFDAAWQGMAVTDNSIVQAIKLLRIALGSQLDGKPYVETVSKKGYRFIARVVDGAARHSDAALDELVEPHRTFMDGRAALETLERDAVTRARQAFEQALRVEPDFPAAHIGCATAWALEFQATRADAAPDLAALRQAEEHAREACRLDPASGHAWSTRAFVHYLGGRSADAIAAAGRAVLLEPDDWRHHVRLAFVSWGQDRVKAARQVLTLCPGLALGHWFAATVFVARETYDLALQELCTGCALQDAQPRGQGRFGAVGLHLVHGLVLAAQGSSEAALAALERELAFEASGHVYARECCANAWYGIGALHLRAGRRDAALHAFREALTRVPGHSLAAVGIAALSASGPLTVPPARNGESAVDRAIVQAAVLTLAGKHDEAAGLCAAALAQADPGSSGWILPVEPLLHVSAHRAAWAPTLATLRARAF